MLLATYVKEMLVVLFDGAAVALSEVHWGVILRVLVK